MDRRLLVRPDDRYTILVSRRPHDRHLGWYVNLQEPMRRNPIGFEAMDLMLDVVVEPALSWRWRDGEEFDEIVERSILGRLLRVRRRTRRVSIGGAMWDDEHPPCLDTAPMRH